MSTELSFEACKLPMDLNDQTKYIKVQQPPKQKAQMNNLLQYLPQITAANSLANAWVAHFPPGYSPVDMIRYNAGGLGNTLMRNGEFAGYAPLTSLQGQAMMLGVFTILSAATGQYFLSRIDSQLSLVNDKLDDVLGFLYGENRAELLSEIAFVKRSHDNFSSIMLSEPQRQATIIGLQSAQKIAMKDIEFYLSDLEQRVQKKIDDSAKITTMSDECFRAVQCAELALQTFVMSCLLEIYYANNFDSDYIKYMSDEMSSLINRCGHSIVITLSDLRGKTHSYRPKPFEKPVNFTELRQRIELKLGEYQNIENSPIRQSVAMALNNILSEHCYYLDSAGNIYEKRLT